MPAAAGQGEEVDSIEPGDPTSPIAFRPWYLGESGEAKFVTPWDIRAFVRALVAAMLGLLVVWLVTSASDEGQLTVGARAGRTLPLAPLCSAVGAALALGTARVRQESRAFEALGRSPAEIGRAAAIGAALPSVVLALAMAAHPRVDVSAFYPRVARGDAFVATPDGFVSTSLGVRIDASGDSHALVDADNGSNDDGLPRRARAAAAAATGLAGIALSLVAARAALRRSLLDRRGRSRMRALAFTETIGCALLTLIAFQAAAARLVSPLIAVVPASLLLVVAVLRRRFGAPRITRSQELGR